MSGGGESSRSHHSAPLLSHLHTPPGSHAVLTDPLNAQVAISMTPRVHSPRVHSPGNSSDNIGYFTLDDVRDGRDYLIDLSPNVHPLQYPPDVQGYLECVSRWEAKKPNGIPAINDMSTAGGGYVPDQQAIREGSKVLRREQVRNPKQFFTAPFSSIAMRASPRYPWRVQMTAAEKEDWLARTVDPVNGVFPGDELLFISNIRIPLPKGFTPPARNPYWVALIGQLYGSSHPLLMFEIYYWYSEVNIDQQLVYDLAHLGGQQPAFPSNLPAEPED